MADIVCEFCNKKFSKKKFLLRHIISHSDLKPFECSICSKMYKSKASLQRHVNYSHEGISNHKCNECGASFAQRSNLFTHIERLHPKRRTSTRSYACSECNCVFTRLNALNRHKSSRHPPYEFKICEQWNDDQIIENPNQFAELVVSQLKSLEKEISYPSNENEKSLNDLETSENDDELPSLETTSIDDAKVYSTTIIDRLHPDGALKTIDVQMVKRAGNRLAYVCEYCGKEFTKKYNLIRHLRTHNSERPYKCPYCIKCFATESKLLTHSNRKHILDETGLMTNQYKCCICYLNFDSIKQLDSHTRSHALDHSLQYTCSTCNETFNTISEIVRHDHNPKEDAAALDMIEELIPVPINLGSALITNKPSSMPRQNLLCKLCGLLLQSKEALKKHTKHHNSIKTFKCSICGISYQNKISLYVHKKLHKPEMQFSCDICNNSRSFFTQSQLHRHIEYVHKKIPNLQCVYCPKLFKTESHCRSHMKTHLKGLIEDNNDTCNGSAISMLPVKATAIVQELNDTEKNSTKLVKIEVLPKYRRHEHKTFQINVLDDPTNEQPPAAAAAESTVSTTKDVLTCPYCSKDFKKSNDLSRHIRSHTMERPFRCEICSKSFTLKSTLNDHQKTHENDSERKTLTCQVCGKSYASSKSLSVHMRLHTAVLPFRCELCGKSFRTSGHRLSHMRAAKTENGQCKNPNRYFFD